MNIAETSGLNAIAGGLAAAYIVPAVLLQGMIWPEYWGVNLPQNYFLFDGNKQAFMKFLESYVAAWALSWRSRQSCFRWRSETAAHCLGRR